MADLVNRLTVEAARDQALEFIAACEELLDATTFQWHDDAKQHLPTRFTTTSFGGFGKLTATVRRRSMDLTRSLADMRRPS